MPLPSFVQKIIKNYPHPPLPTAEFIASKINKEKYLNLQPDHIQDIITWILDETKISQKFGLYFDENILLREIIFFLVFVNSFGGLIALKNKLLSLSGSQYEKFSHEVSIVQFENFSKESDYFLKRMKLTKETVSPNAFDCHLFCVRTTILRNISNYRPPKS